MKQNRIISTALLFLLLGIPAFAYAKKGPKEKGGGGQKSQQAQQRGNQQGQRAADKRGNNGNHYGRIPDDHFRANFGPGHMFRIGSPRFINGYNRFRYSGYLFGDNERWPSGWNYNDDVYVDYIMSLECLFTRQPAYPIFASSAPEPGCLQQPKQQRKRMTLKSDTVDNQRRAAQG